MATIVAATGAAGNWTSGGAWVGGVAPTAADSAQITVLTTSLTIDVGALCQGADFTGFTGTLTQGATGTLTIGNASAALSNIALNMPSGFTYAPNASSTINFVSTSATQQTISSVGYTMGNMNVNGAGNNYAITANLTLGATSTFFIGQGTLHTDGAADTSGLTHSWGKVDTTGSSLTHAVNLGNSTLTITGTGIAWNSSGSTFTLTKGNSVLIFTGANAQMEPASKSFNEVRFTGSGGVLIYDSSGSTFTIFRRIGTALKTDSITLQNNLTVSTTLEFTGNSATNRLFVTSNSLGTQKTINYNSATNPNTTMSNVDLRDLVAAGTFGAWNLASITGNSGDCGGNSNITFTTPATQTATMGTSKNWSDITIWTSRVPLPQDDASLASVTGGTLSSDMPRMARSISWTGATGSPTWTLSVFQAYTWYGSLTLISGMTWNGVVSSLTNEARGAFTLTSAGKTFTNNLQAYMIGGSLTLQDAASFPSLSFRNGTFDANGFNVTASGTVDLTFGGTKTLNMGSGTWTLNGTGTVWNVDTIGTFTLNAQTSTILISDTSGTQKVFTGGTTRTYNNITVTGKFVSFTYTTSMTCNVFALNNLGDTQGVAFRASATLNVSGFTTTASSGNVAKLVSTSGGTPATISKTSGTVSVDWVSIQDSAATGGAAFYAGANSTNVSGNSGWIFTAPPGGSSGNMFLVF